MKRAKKYAEAAKEILPSTLYPVDDAFKLVRETSVAEFNATVKVMMRLNVDPHKASQLAHGTVNLPHDTGRTMHALVFAVGEKTADAQAAGTDEVGDDELIKRVSRGYTDFDVAVATPDLIGKVGRLGKALGPRDLMPNPKTGTVIVDVAETVKDIKGSRIKSHADKRANLQFAVDKMSFDAEKLAENCRAVFEKVVRLRPSTVKGRYITKATVSTTMGPSVPLALAERKEA